MGISDLMYGTPLLFLPNDIKHLIWNWSMAYFSYACCSGDKSSMVTSITSPISGILSQLERPTRRAKSVLTQNPHLALSTQQAEQAGLTHEQIPKHANQLFLKLTKGNAVKYQILELAGWY
jgi:hypothetical protein